ncbi:MAG: Myo-inositol-1-phosphate synthase [Candidatus Methanofastidiosum methylothiophilum]|uniref:Myo-inositol-1-phosphate synthase n=1 Tax=Candidatus Methanofastidiosum methylothiophilum TaxID=1705564 RepID=A0A150IW12_9EURY|nr:MAG: Myo-inositol-1-phosphate synthase [Candidatus Methanofastidiosum methylthiophilus]
MGEIRVAIAGVGNCASSLVQGIEYYRNNGTKEIIGLMNENLGGYRPQDLKFVVAFDIDKRKVGKDISEAIFASPNCTKTIYKNIPKFGGKVMMGPVLDGFAAHMDDYSEDRRFVVSDEKPCDVVSELKKHKVDVLINYMPVGSEKATKFYAEAALEAGVAFVNCMPVFIASDERWAKRFEDAGIPIVGDDIKSQLGATIVHRVLTKLFQDRGVIIDRTYQLNTGGNTDFLNMLEKDRLKSKKISKTEAVQSQLDIPLHPDNIHIGPSDYVPWLNDNKLCFLRLEGRGFGDIPLNLELRLSVEDSPNSAGVAIDAIRCAKLGLDREIGGPLTSISSYTMKHPLIQYSDSEAKIKVEEFISGKLER